MGWGVRVSVVVTNHQYGRYVGAAIDTALAQDHDDVEVVVVDDGSTDDSRHVIAGYGDRVVTVLRPNGGQAAAMNDGFAACSGDAVIFLDGDDELEPDVASRVAALLDARPEVGRVQYPLAVIDADGRATGERVPVDGRPLFEGDARPRLATCPDDLRWQPTSGNAFRRAVLERVMPIPEAELRLCADFHLSTLTPLYGHVAVLAEPGGRYRVHGRNGHFGADGLDRLRADVRRTLSVRRSLVAHARLVGLRIERPVERIPSLSHAAQRTVSWRLAPADHPVEGDGRASLVWLSLRSARARRDLAPVRRVAAGAWALSLAVLPRRVLPLVAAPVTSSAGVLRWNGRSTRAAAGSARSRAG